MSTWDIMDKLPKENHMLDDEDPNKFIAKMGAEALENAFWQELIWMICRTLCVTKRPQILLSNVRRKL